MMFNTGYNCFGNMLGSPYGADPQSVAMLRRALSGTTQFSDTALANIACSYTANLAREETLFDKFDSEEARVQRSLYPPEDYPYLYEMKWKKYEPEA